VTPTPTETVTPTPTVTATVTPTATATVTPTPTVTATVTSTATVTVTPTATITPTPTVTVTLTPTRTVSATASVTPTVTATYTPTPTVTPTATGTATSTATPSSTPTTTPTPSSSTTPTATPVTTPSGTPVATATPGGVGCGNGTLDPGEECDDGNTADGDGCSSQCRSELIPGTRHRFGKRECFHEWLAPPVLAVDAHGLPSNRLDCTDDDPTCDHGAAAGDEACTFHVALCFNVVDTRRIDVHTGAPMCMPSDVERLYLMTRSRFANQDSPDATDEANRDALDAALAGIGAVERGECTRDDSTAPRLCSVDAECDTSPGSGDGTCRGRLLAFVPPLVDQGVCTGFADVVVPLTRVGVVLQRGEKWIRLRTMPEHDPVTGECRAGDTDFLRLYCDPQP
jgi:cysteine-rich repeat protein